MALNPLLPFLLLASLAGLAADRLRRGRAPRDGAGWAGPGLTWAALGLAATALLAPALALPDGIPSPAADLARHAPWRGTADPEAGPTAAAGSPAGEAAAEAASVGDRAAAAAGRGFGNPALRDVTYQVQPWLLFLRAELRAGRLPFWNPYQYSGTPFWSNGSGAPLFPLHLLFAALPLQAGWVLLPWLRLMAAGMGARALARALGLSEPAALLAAIVYPLSGMLVGFALYPMGSALALVPWVLFAVERLASGRSGAAPLALAAGLQLLAGHPETAVHTALLSALYLAVRGTAPGVAAPGAWLRLAAGWALGGALAAVQLVPLALTLLASSRWQAAGGEFAEPLARLLAQPLRLVLPDLYGNPAHGTWWGPYNYLATAVYAGALALPLAGAGLGRIGRRAAGTRDRRWLAVAAVLLFCFAAAYHLPGVRQLLAAPPVIGRAAHHRLIFGLELSLALLAAAGWERWRGARGGRALGAGAALAAALLATAWLRFAGEWEERGLLAEQALRTGAVLGGAAILLAALKLPARGRRTLAALVPIAFAADLVLAHAAINPGLSSGRLYPETGAVRFLQSRGGRIAAEGHTLHPNAAMVYRLHDVRGDDSVKLATYEREVGASLGAGHPTYFAPIRRWDSPWLDRLGVRWVITGPGAAAPRPEWRLAYDGADARVYERAGALPAVRWSGGGGGARAEVALRGHGRWRVRWAAPGRALLVVAEAYDAGWSARSGEGPVPVRVAEGALLGVELGPGEGTVDLVYRPAGIGWGALASALGLPAVLFLARRRRRPGAEAPP